MTRRARKRDEPEDAEVTEFFCPVAAQTEAFESRLAASETRLDTLEGRVAELDEELADETHGARKREGQLQAQADAVARRLEALELQTAEVQELRQKLADVEQEVLAVAERTLAAAIPSDIAEGACVWDRHDGQGCVAIAPTIVDVREAGPGSDGRAHRVVGWVVRDSAGGYRARPMAELSTVRPRMLGQSRDTLGLVLLCLFVAAITALLMLVWVRS